ncbi:hypothetical protein [Capnocytophaga canis]|uniref:hypothetical protein n=1 Tax=Capnocytophaga canis TaxID=1848903 RepID=UPI003B9688E8
MNKQDNIIIYGVQYPNPDSVHWEAEEYIDFRLSSIEYRTLLQGYPPDWDCRYAPFQFQDWLYITRSGFWLKKIKYEKQEDGFYHLSRHLTSEKGRGHNLLLEIFCNGYFKPSLFEVVQRAGILNRL